MNNLSKLMVGLAAFSLAACSSDEPTPSTPDVNDGTTMYLNVRIKSANMGGSRAENTNSGNEEWKYDWGKSDEHAVSTADFFFFDEAGIYVAQANVWNGGNASTDNENIEYISNNILVLKGLTKKQTPKYMVTVLNANTALKAKLLANVTTLDQFRKEICNYTEIQDAEKNNLFVMSTTSYYDNSEGFKYGATILGPNNLSTQAPDENGKVDPTKLTPVDVYVERLAVKYTMNAANREQTVQITVSGFGNEQTGNEAYENIKLEITGFGVTNIADQSYITKNIDGFNATTPWSTPESWNKPEYFRSFWAKSLYYDNEDETGLVGTKFAASNDNLTSAVYSNENTKPFATLQGTGNRVKANLTTNVVFTARIKDANGNDLKLVNFNGLYFKEEQFVKYVLFRMQQTGNLNFYKQVSSTSSETDGIIENGATYVQVGPADVVPSRPDPAIKDAHMTLAAIENLGQLYAYDAEAEAGKKFTPIADGAAALNAAIEEFFQAASNGAYPVRYNGYTVYTRPIEHLLGSNNNSTFEVTKDGEYGVVRNHWYNFDVTKILNMGDGVFNPDGGDDGDIIIPDPDPKPEKYALAARVNILSWKIVKQEIEL